MHYNCPVGELTPGSMFAGYRIECVAGRGGMGIVYRAVDLSLDRTVALKFIAPELGDNASFRRRFTAESKVAASLDHPNVIPIFQAGEQDGALFLVMRHVEGVDMRDDIADHGRLDPPRAVGIIAQVASALDAAHAAGLVHRDVKPANILLTPTDHAYLTDFGLSKRLLSETDETETGHLLGTLNYLAPEQIRAEGVEPRTDVYALGCVLYHALTGGVPFPMEEREAKLWAHLSAMPPPVPAGVPEGFDEIIARAMAKQPSDRFASAGALAKAAEAAAKGGRRAPAHPAPARAEPVPTQPIEPPLPAAASRPSARRLLIINAATAPFSVVVLLATLVAGLILGVLPEAIPVAVLVYVAAAAVIYFDRDVQRKVIDRERAKSDDPAAALAAPGETKRMLRGTDGR